MKYFLHISRLLCFLTVMHLVAQEKIEHLIPPALTQKTFTTKMFCDRPKRRAGPNISLETKYDKTIANCFGHGGAGYVTLFGSIQESLDLFLKTSPDVNTPVCVIGSGCFGLSMALALKNKGFKQVRIVTKEIYDMPSWRAGGFFDPGTGQETSDSDKRLLKLGLATFEEYQRIEQGKHPFFSRDIVRRLPIYCHKEVEAGVEVLEALKEMPAREQVTLDFGNGAVHPHYNKFVTYFIDVTKVMKQLWAEVELQQIPVVRQEVRSFNDCPEKVIFNCGGLPGSKLSDDRAVFPMRGHFFMVDAAKGSKKLDYMLFTKVKQNDAKECIYLFPKEKVVSAEHPEGKEFAGILGGTFIPHVDELSDEARKAMDMQEFEKLERRTKEFFYGTDN